MHKQFAMLRILLFLDQIELNRIELHKSEIARNIKFQLPPVVLFKYQDREQEKKIYYSVVSIQNWAIVMHNRFLCFYYGR